MWIYSVWNTSLSIETGVPVRAVISHGFKKWFNIEGNSAIVTRYRLDSQFHCPYIESREVPEKTRQKPGEKKAREIRGESAGNYLTFISDSSLLVTSFPVTSGDDISGDATSGYVISGDDPPHDPQQIINILLTYTYIWRYLKTLYKHIYHI